MPPKYEKKTQREHILLRPDTYVDSLALETSHQWILDGNKFTQKSVEWVPGLYKLFDEVLVNAMDQTRQDPTVDSIKVLIDSERVEVTNTSKGIPIEKHESGVYIPELIFGQLLTSSNYDDTQDRTTGGRNGFGAKLANVFSTRFDVEVGDTHTGKLYRQTFENNMTVIGKPKITKYSKAKGYVTIRFWPDFNRLGVDSINETHQKIFERRCYDTCVNTPTKVSVWLNGSKLTVKSFQKYVEMYTDAPKVYESVDANWEVCVAQSNDYRSISFVNGIATTDGGKHVDLVTNRIVKDVIEMIKTKKKNKDVVVKPNYVKENMFVFVKTLVYNPEFDNQCKTRLKGANVRYASKVEFSTKFVKDVCSKLGIIEGVMALVDAKDRKELNKTDGRKTNNLKGIPKLDDANYAGTVKSGQCTLYLTEGDSAKQCIVAGLSVVGRDLHGVYPLKGKTINAMNATAKDLADNKEITELKRILGLEHGKKYTDTSMLRYGKICICTDADTDGYHIRGLILCLLKSQWPELAKIKGFVTYLKTPIVKATRGKQVVAFYTLDDFKAWQVKNPSGWKVKYYKGLGTSQAHEAKEYFKDLDTHLCTYKWDSIADKNVDLAFDKAKADVRKDWLQKPLESDEGKSEVTVTKFLNSGLLEFWKADNIRSISAIDGFKESQRKIMWGCFQRLSSEKKVSEIAGEVSTVSAYHHGEVSLNAAIVGMAQNFVGSNNINLLMPNGAFGSRAMGGKDAASSRYIFTEIPKIAKEIFHPLDNPVLKYKTDDNRDVEPEIYWPVLPMLLINGATGIGTGYSTEIPCHNPMDLIGYIRDWLNNKKMPKYLVPWYRGFKGVVESKGGKWYTRGLWNKLGASKIEITELPVGVWTDSFKETLDKDKDGVVKKWVFGSRHTDEDVHIVIDLAKPVDTVDIVKVFKLQKSISYNLHVHGKTRVKRYSTTLEILTEFCKGRLKVYDDRRSYLLNTWEHELTGYHERYRFVMMMINEEYDLRKKAIAVVHEELRALGFVNVNELTSMRVSAMTAEELDRLSKLIGDQESRLAKLRGQTAKDLWLEDLGVVEATLKKAN